MSHGHDGGVAISVVLNEALEVREETPAGPMCTHTHTPNERAEMPQNGSNKLRFQAFYLDVDQPLALRAIQGGTPL